MTRSDLWFEQKEALAALTYLDELDGTDVSSRYADSWRAFVKDKPYWDLEKSRLSFRSEVSRLQRVAEAIGRGLPDQ